jgi:hypothetical protein
MYKGYDVWIEGKKKKRRKPLPLFLMHCWIVADIKIITVGVIIKY